MSITIKKVSYTKPKDARILEAVMTKWFKNPKDLNLTDPRMAYPFSFKKWVAMTYANDDIHSFALVNEKWIVGIGNLMIIQDSNRAHALHIYIDKEYRGQGLGEKMMKYLESLAREKQIETMTLRVMPKNEPARKLYEKLGFELNGTSKLGSLMLEKKLV
ncbi:MAG: GNAT family N-acetyltransferase [Candidatus Marinimicrobia bacterium]|jgi:ribosomal protein S18 acetylase RimI-like enzyme|nr:GNAT family N-acetyltransferase [Candidatus Neomarinimicrobiota bacterium]MBT3675331.1 GNAT family N-acetyltransferase [Candidatus Neomarinimicrobiota bacterium]MBT3763167.1 GNAT family N-acetyltransferase [Candidatus Neomarinimicrobiota bacterium]MBT4068913.1 GNAT family N-acetyltransferase [Candidatus Neomarinimicrobiota bacterium]MBT4270806.1 GNAT family N-acetyltransferase [Candidatus Neomarinimicrobiota bacterium]